jgi:hypothetical protein
VIGHPAQHPFLADRHVSEFVPALLVGVDPSISTLDE